MAQITSFVESIDRLMTQSSSIYHNIDAEIV